MRVVVAPDSFKGTIGAADAAAALATGWRRVRPADEVIEIPLADGGEGTLAVLAAAVAGSRWHRAEVSGPAQAQVAASWLEIPGNEHIIELATAAGLTQLRPLQPLAAHSYGVGQLMGRALDGGARRIVVALGGSACTDGGSGALAALGARFLDAAGAEVRRGGGALARLARVDTSGLRPPPPGGVDCLTDVRAPLLGPSGAAAVFGPQKGAGPGEIAVLEEGLARLARALGGDPEAPGAGAAGGTGYGLSAAWGAVLRPGALEIAAIAGLPAALAGAGLVITGEGQYDATSQSGKVAGAVLAHAAAAGVPAAVVAGVLADRVPAGVRGVELAALAGDREAASADPARWLSAAGRDLAAGLAGPLR
ncbi:MAG TPA: glycerate kinase [Streptosporangiaceae bacterium]|nr:glycerate kinase [Streptosporangiaceae bacterium]